MLNNEKKAKEQRKYESRWNILSSMNGSSANKFGVI